LPVVVAPAVVNRSLNAPPSLSLSAQGGTIVRSSGQDWSCQQPTECNWTGALPIAAGQQLPQVHSRVRATSHSQVVVTATLKAADLEVIGTSTTRILLFCLGAHFRGSVPGVLVPEHRHLRGPVTGGIIVSPNGCAYRLTATDGGVFVFGDTTFRGSVPGVLGAKKLNGRVFTGFTPLPRTNGYWLVARDGGVFSFGRLAFYGSLPGLRTLLHKRLPGPVVAAASTPDGRGYWLVTANGGVFTFGDAKFYGTLPQLIARLHEHVLAHIVALVPTADGRGYWIVTSSGGVFSFGNARFYGSMGGTSLNKPIVAAAATQDGKGYWLFGADGGVFAFGDASFQGSLPAILAEKHEHLQAPIVGALAAPDGQGYWLIAADGGVFTLRGDITAVAGEIWPKGEPWGHGRVLEGDDATVEVRLTEGVVKNAYWQVCSVQPVECHTSPAGVQAWHTTLEVPMIGTSPEQTPGTIHVRVELRVGGHVIAETTITAPVEIQLPVAN